MPHYHWHLEIIPRMTNAAGFEWGTGLHINPTPPEEAAKFLREAAF
jgi:UDPglucose--hexose-1-phosphate uridylyltransferase